jgi:hypothetical protein
MTINIKLGDFAQNDSHVLGTWPRGVERVRAPDGSG